MGPMQVRDIPADLRQQFKAACHLQGRTMTEVIAQLMRQYAEAELGPGKVATAPASR